MPSFQMSHHYASSLSAKQALRAHVTQLSPAKQREFMDCALQLIAQCILMEEVEAQLGLRPRRRGKKPLFN